MSRRAQHRAPSSGRPGALVRLLDGLGSRPREHAADQPHRSRTEPDTLPTPTRGTDATDDTGRRDDPSAVPVVPVPAFPWARVPAGPASAAAAVGGGTASRTVLAERPAPTALAPAWQDWADRRRADDHARAVPAVPTPRRVPFDTSAATFPPETSPAPGDATPLPGRWAHLALHDGRTVTVTSTSLLGRHPAARPGETPGALVIVTDPQRSVSKTHLAVGMDDAGVWVVDRGSTNGTVVTLPDGQRILCVPERRVRLALGASVAFGDAAFTLTAVSR